MEQTRRPIRTMLYRFLIFTVVLCFFSQQHNKLWDYIEHSRIQGTQGTQDTLALQTVTNRGSIRRWGCNLKETPFIFVHIGKAGGGSIRRKIATAATNYTRKASEWYDSGKDTAYYPLRSDNGTLIAKARFCNSKQKHYLPYWEKTFEGMRLCTATTPIGRALACPAYQVSNEEACGVDIVSMESSRFVYVGHNDFGNEINVLPVPYLQEWWRQHWAPTESTTNKPVDAISQQWYRLDPNNTWCGNMRRPWQDVNRMEMSKIAECGKQMQGEVDNAAFESIQKHMSMDTLSDRGRAWSAVYASLPLIRVVMIRNPFSWFASLFSWHSLHIIGVVCDNVTNAVAVVAPLNVSEKAEFKQVEVFDQVREWEVANMGAPGWLRSYALIKIYQLCGADCRVRHFKNQATLEELKEQAEYNLRNAFAVVGILEDGEDQFFEMINTRVDYIDIKMNATLEDDGTHGSSSRGEKGRCKARFKNVTFQQELIAASPEVAALVHLYQVAVRVNRFQKRELMQCKRSTEQT